MTLICDRCGTETPRTGTNQRYCPVCAPKAYDEAKRQHMRGVRKKNRQAKQAHKLCQPKPDMRGIGECERWQECFYGAEDESTAYSGGACQYMRITGCCKVVTGPDGSPMVEPTKSCRFFKQKEVVEDA